jgi:hypothetical protein
MKIPTILQHPPQLFLFWPILQSQSIAGLRISRHASSILVSLPFWSWLAMELVEEGSLPSGLLGRVRKEGSGDKQKITREL